MENDTNLKPKSPGRIKSEKNLAPPWKPGQSTNPWGRPKRGETIAELMRNFLNQEDPKEKMKHKEIFVRKVYAKAVDEGDVKAMALLWSYVDGKPKESIDVTSAGEKMSNLIIYRPEKNDE